MRSMPLILSHVFSWAHMCLGYKKICHPFGLIQLMFQQKEIFSTKRYGIKRWTQEFKHKMKSIQVKMDAKSVNLALAVGLTISFNINGLSLKRMSLSKCIELSYPLICHALTNHIIKYWILLFINQTNSETLLHIQDGQIPNIENPVVSRKSWYDYEQFVLWSSLVKFIVAHQSQNNLYH